MYFRAMTDVSAEHEKFTVMKQESGESTMVFRARLLSQVRLCKYSEEDQVRFVRSQLLKGMANRELARTARMFNYDTEFIVQSASRYETFEEEAGPSGSNVLTISPSKQHQAGHRTLQVNKQWSGPRNNRRDTSEGPPTKRQNVGGQEYGEL